ncbi:MAG: hypothetical protein ABSA03_07565, partial [Streptosporangiaceae bacterium]
HTRMADFAAEVRRLMTERGMSLRGLAKASNYDPSYPVQGPVRAQAVIPVPGRAWMTPSARTARSGPPPRSRRHAGRRKPAHLSGSRRARSKHSRSR